jgi:hypothetical protein
VAVVRLKFTFSLFSSTGLYRTYLHCILKIRLLGCWPIFLEEKKRKFLRERKKKERKREKFQWKDKINVKKVQKQRQKSAREVNTGVPQWEKISSRTRPGGGGGEIPALDRS